MDFILYWSGLQPFGPAMKSDDYRAVNPMGKVPAVRHRDGVVTECAAITAPIWPTASRIWLLPLMSSAAAIIAGCSSPQALNAVSNRSLGFGSRRTAPHDRLRRFRDVMDTLGSPSRPVLRRRTGFYGRRRSMSLASPGACSSAQSEKRPAFVEYLARVSDRPAFRSARERTMRRRQRCGHRRPLRHGRGTRQTALPDGQADPA